MYILIFFVKKTGLWTNSYIYMYCFIFIKITSVFQIILSLSFLVIIKNRALILIVSMIMFTKKLIHTCSYLYTSQSFLQKILIYKWDIHLFIFLQLWAWSSSGFPNSSFPCWLNFTFFIQNRTVSWLLFSNVSLWIPVGFDLHFILP